MPKGNELLRDLLKTKGGSLSAAARDITNAGPVSVTGASLWKLCETGRMPRLGLAYAIARYLGRTVYEIWPPEYADVEDPDDDTEPSQS